MKTKDDSLKKLIKLTKLLLRLIKEKYDRKQK